VIQDVLVPNKEFINLRLNKTSGRNKLQDVSNALTLLGSLAEGNVNSVQEIYKDFISGSSNKPADVTHIINLLGALVKEGNVNLNALENKVTTTLATLTAATKSGNEAVTKAKVGEAKKVAKAQQAHDDAKAQRTKEKPGLDHQIMILKQVMQMLWPHSDLAYFFQNCDSVSKCGDWGDVCMGSKGRNPFSVVKSLVPGKTYTFTLNYIPIYTWDNEYGRVLANKKQCFSQQFQHGSMKLGRSCGKYSHGYAKSVGVTCKGVATKDGEIRIEATSTLDQGMSDESFGVSNLRFFLPDSVVRTWEKCDSVSECGDWGSVCMGSQGHNPFSVVKSLVPGKTYTITLNYIPIYTWDNEYGRVLVNKRLCYSKKFLHSNIKLGRSCGKNSHGHAKLFGVTCNEVATKDGEIRIEATSTLNSPLADESFGVSNLKVNLKV
jgi:hypothetical protein